MAHWILVTTQPNREKWAAENVIRQGHNCYLPMVRVSRGKGLKRVTLLQPLFRRYLFVENDGEWRYLMGTFGVTGVVCLESDEPTPVPNFVLDELKARESEHEPGVVELPKKKFTKGQRVIVGKGPFRGRVGIAMGSSNKEIEEILLDILGGKRTAFIAKQDLHEEGETPDSM